MECFYAILHCQFHWEKCSAMFGNEMWPAAEYGRTMYTIRQRIGTLLMKMEKRYGTHFSH